MRYEITRGKLALALLGAGILASALVRKRRRISLEGRVAVITGGGRGLGAAITRELVARGCYVAICGRDEHEIQAMVERLQSQGARAFGMSCDVSDPTATNSFVQQVLDRFGSIDILVNNAGQCFVGPAVELRSADLHRALRDIFWVNFYPTMAVLPHMRRKGFGRIANITSIGGRLAIPHQAAYVAAKHAATGWSYTLALEVSRDGISVSTISPPPIKNGAALHVHFGGQVQEEFRWFTKALTSPWTATSAERTACVVVDAIEHGDADRSVTPTSWLSARLFGAAPNLMLRLLTLFERRLPPAGRVGISTPMRLGSEIVSHTSDPGVLELGHRAESDGARYRSNGAPGAGS
ncbi:MAG: SDR family NAD(P)-dependent oxidoreductase [Myxococcota bacterium]